MGLANTLGLSPAAKMPQGLREDPMARRRNQWRHLHPGTPSQQTPGVLGWPLTSIDNELFLGLLLPQ